MCIVTYLPTNDGFLLTSNRDECVIRASETISINQYKHNDNLLTYPKDKYSNGTWIAFNNLNAVAVLLNGAFQKHQKSDEFKYSRGSVIIELLQSKDPFNRIKNFCFKGFEPFTLIVIYDKQLIEFRWDNTDLIETTHNLNCKLIWSSVTLYSDEIYLKNKSDFLNNDLDVLVFHSSNKYELLFPSESKKSNIKTVSITQIEFKLNKLKMRYLNLL